MTLLKLFQNNPKSGRINCYDIKANMIIGLGLGYSYMILVMGVNNFYINNFCMKCLTKAGEAKRSKNEFLF